MDSMDGGHALVEEVATALEQEPRVSLGWRPLRISLDHGDLLLEGEVEDVAAKKLALERAARVGGVDRIIDRLHVSSGVELPDSVLVARLCAAFAGEPLFKLYRFIPRALRPRELPKLEAGHTGFIAVKVKDGVVTLDGEVGSLRHKRLAGHLAWWIAGVKDVVNGLGVEPPQADSDDEITVSVLTALEKDPDVHPLEIDVETRDAVVRLQGAVHTVAEARAAERDAWCTFGVDRVENDLQLRADAQPSV